MTAQEFDRVLKKKRETIEEKNEPPVILEETLIEYFKAQNYLYSSTILEVVYAWRHFESLTSSEINSPFYNTIRVINTLVELSNHRIQLCSTLLSVKGDIYIELGETQKAAEAFIDAVDGFYAEHLNVDVQRIGSMVKLAQTLFSLGNIEDSEKIFLDILSYPWYLVKEADIRERLRDFYVNAGIGVIECRKGNLNALEETYFVPATHPQLIPELEKAIMEAKAV